MHLPFTDFLNTHCAFYSAPAGDRASPSGGPNPGLGGGSRPAARAEALHGHHRPAPHCTTGFRTHGRGAGSQGPRQPLSAPPAGRPTLRGSPGRADQAQPSRGRPRPTPGCGADRKASGDASCAGATAARRRRPPLGGGEARRRRGGGEAAARGPDHVRTTWRPRQPRAAVGLPDRPRRAAGSPRRRRDGSPRRCPR